MGSPSLSSTASWTPVDAPEGTAARPVTPVSNVISASTVGFPLESRICLPLTLAITDIGFSRPSWFRSASGVPIQPVGLYV